MATEQYKTGYSSVTPGATTISGYGTVWSTQLQAGDVFKPDIDQEPTQVIASIGDNTTMTLSNNWGGSQITYQKYMVQRSFTINRLYARPYQGDADLADILREQVIDKIDDDMYTAMYQVGKIYKRATTYEIPSGCTYNFIVMTAGTTITLHAASDSRVFKIAKSSGNTLTATIQISGGGTTDTIEGVNKVFLQNQYDTVTLVGDGGTKWYKL